MISITRLRLVLLLCVAPRLALPAEPPRNFFTNPSFELGRDGWDVSKAGKTVCQLTLDNQDAAAGQASALLTIDTVDDWGVQFGQSFAAGQKGKAYTFAVSARSLGEPVEVGLQIERNARPWDRAAGGRFKLTRQWQELHVTFTLDKDFPEGWFAYISCAQPKAQFRVDMFRLYEGPYTPFRTIAQQEVAQAAVQLFDTGIPSPAPLAAALLTRKPAWTEIPEDKIPTSFKGDAVLINDRLALVLRQGASGAELYSLSAGVASQRAVLAPVGSGSTRTLKSFTVLENSQASGAAEATFAASDGQTLSLRFELKLGQPFVLTERRAATVSLRVETACRFVIMPDFFADDIVVDAEELPITQAELPSDNLLLRLTPDCQAIVMTVLKRNAEDIHVAVAGSPGNRLFTDSELRFDQDGKIWVGVLAAPAIWHQPNIPTNQIAPVTRLDWKAPFPAQWRIDWRQQHNLTDSWEMLNEGPAGGLTKQSLTGGQENIPANRKRWTTVLGEFQYPAWIDREGYGCLQPLNRPALRLRGPALIYPINRVASTPLDAFTVLDLVRNTLGVGPCEYVLDVEGQQSKYKGRATCSVRDTLNPIYASGQQLQRTAEIEKVLEDLMIFIRHIRGRIEGYVAFGHATLAYLAEQKQAHPELAGGLRELDDLARTIDTRLAARREQIKTPDEAARMVEEFRRTVLHHEGQDALAKCKQYTEGWVGIGGNQDELVGECRWAVRMIRQRAGLLMAADPRLAEVAKEIRRRSQEVLRNPAIHEGARH